MSGASVKIVSNTCIGLHLDLEYTKVYVFESDACNPGLLYKGTVGSQGGLDKVDRLDTDERGDG